MNPTQVMTTYFASCKKGHTRKEYLATFGFNPKDDPEECAKIMAKVGQMKKRFAKKLFGAVEKWPHLKDSREDMTFEKMQDILKASGWSA